MWKTPDRAATAVEAIRRGDLLEYRVLGPLQVRRSGEAVELGVYKQRALLALLLIEANRVVSVDRIIDELWAGSTGKDPQSGLWVVVSRLRSALEPDRPNRSDGTALLTRAPGYMISVDRDRLDSALFEALVVEGRALLASDPDAASLALGEALALWHGRAFEEFTYEPFAQAEIARLEEIRLSAVEDRVEADLRRGMDRHLIAELESLVRQHPLRERLTGQLMLALYRSGRQSDALRAFGALKDTLAEEMGLDPNPGIVTLEERILLDDPSLRIAPHESQVVGGRTQFSLRGYEVREVIGENSAIREYRAYQPAVGREVTIRAIGSDLANDPDFIRRFEAWAHGLAGFEHASVVPIQDFWREPGAAFVVTPPLGGETLQLWTGNLDVSAAVRILKQVGAALAHAHRRDLVHGNLNPSNILIDDHGDAHLVDFGVPWADASDPTQSFVAPEQRNYGAAKIASDVFALGAVGRFALSGIDAGNMPATLDAVLQRATARDAALRHPDVASFLDELDRAAGTEPLPGHADFPNPYRGLRAFGESDTGWFFGRERVVERLVARLGQTGIAGRAAVLVGPSGSGKSSVVRAGLIPAFRSGSLPGSASWFTITMTPGRQPFDALADALMGIAVDPPADLRGRLESGIAEAVRAVLSEPDAQVLIVVDQLEELFSHTSAAAADAFLTALCDAVSHPHSPVRLVATLRADFYDQPLRHRAFGNLLRLGSEVISPMTAEELTRAIELPAGEFGVAFEQGLVSRIVSDMAGQPNALPLLQYVLTELFEHRTGDLITASAYQLLGGVGSALSARADDLFGELGPAAKRSARDLFLRLVTVGDSGDDTRRRVLVSELADAMVADPGEILDRFGKARMLTFDRDPTARAPTVEIAHEALLTDWARLAQWIDDARLDVQAQRRLAAAATEWEEGGEDPDFLLSGGRLRRYDGWDGDPPVRLTSQERRYLQQALAAAEAETSAEQHRLRRLKRLVRGIGLALVVAVVAGGVAIAQRGVAEAAADRAELATLISRSAAVGAADPELALLLALEAHRHSPGSETEQAVLTALGASSLASRVASVAPLEDECLGFSSVPDLFQGTVEFATIGERLVKRDPAGGPLVDAGPTPVPCAIGTVHEGIGAAVAPDLLRIWVGPELELELSFAEQTIPEWVTPDRVVVRSGLTEDEDDVVAIHDSVTGERLGVPVSGFIFLDLAINVDESLLAASFVRPLAPEGEGRIYVLDLATGAEIVRLDTPDGPVRMTFDRGTGDLVVGFLGGRIATLDPTTGTTRSEFVMGSAVGFRQLAVQEDGSLLVISAGGVDVVDRETGESTRLVEIRNATAGWVRPDGLVVIQGLDGRLDTFDLEGSAVVDRSWPAAPAGLAAFDDGRAVVLNPELQEVEIIDLATGSRSLLNLSLLDGGPFVASAAFPAPDGVWLLSADHELALVVDGAITMRTSLGSSPSVTGVRLGRTLPATVFEGRLAALGRRSDGSLETSIVRLDAGGATIEATIDTPDAFTVHPSATGGLHVMSASGNVRTYDSSGVLLGEILRGQADPFVVTLDPSGRLLVLGSEDGGSTIVDIIGGSAEVVSESDQVTNLGIGPNGIVAIAMSDGTVRLWDALRSTTLGVVWNGRGSFTGEPGWFDAAAVSMWMSVSSQLIEIPLEPAVWVSTACRVVGRDMTEAEWARYVPWDGPVVSACDGN